jgi:hypothetical protein
MPKHRPVHRGVVLIAVAAAGCALVAGCGPAGQAAGRTNAPAPALTIQQAADVQAAYDKGNNEINQAYDAGAVPRIETLPLQTTSQAWLKIRQQQKQQIPPTNYSGGTFFVPPAGGFPRWFISAATRVRGGVPSARPVYTVFTQQADGLPWLAAYTMAPADTVPAVRTNAAGAAAILTDATGLAVNPATLSAAIFAHSTAATPVDGDGLARTPALDDQLTAGYRVGVETVGARGWVLTRTLDPTTYPSYLLRTTDGGALAFTADVVVDTTKASGAKGTVTLDAGSNEAALAGRPAGFTARQLVIQRLQTFLTYIPPKGSGQKIRVLAYNDTPVNVR